MSASLRDRLATIHELVQHLAHSQRYFLLPLAILLVLTAVLLLATESLGVMAPFVYAIF